MVGVFTRGHPANLRHFRNGGNNSPLFMYHSGIKCPPGAMTLIPTMQDKDSHGVKAVLPYWPVIVFCIMCLTSLGGILVKLDYISKAVDKNEMQFSSMSQQITAQNDRHNLTAQSIIEMRGVNERQSIDISRIEKDVAELKNYKKGAK